MAELKKGDVFFRKLHNDFIQIDFIETHTGGKPKTKLAKPIYHINYLLNHKPPFQTYEADINQMISFKHWVKSHNNE